MEPKFFLMHDVAAVWDSATISLKPACLFISENNFNHHLCKKNSLYGKCFPFNTQETKDSILGLKQSILFNKFDVVTIR